MAFVHERTLCKPTLCYRGVPGRQQGSVANQGTHGDGSLPLRAVAGAGAGTGAGAGAQQFGTDGVNGRTMNGAQQAASGGTSAQDSVKAFEALLDDDDADVRAMISS